jgi:hypothetical protein
MKILCSLSSTEFNCEHFPGSFTSREIHHPIFSLPQKRLLSYLGKWSEGGLTPTDSYLLFLALLKSSDLIEWRVPVMRSADTDAIVANNMEALVRILIKLPTIPSYEDILPHYVISPDTRFLGNVQHWISNWRSCYEDYKSGYKSAHESAIIIRRENALIRMIKSPHRKAQEWAPQLAEWAAVAASFPVFLTPSPFSSSPIPTPKPLAEIWKEIICRCTRDEHIFSIPDSDLQELLTHCETNIPFGSIQSHALFSVLRKAATRKKTFLDLGDPDLKSSYAILSTQQTAESANMTALINSAPTQEPIREHYPSDFMFKKAKLRWDMAVKYGVASSPTSTAPAQSSQPKDDPIPGQEPAQEPQEQEGEGEE